MWAWIIFTVLFVLIVFGAGIWLGWTWNGGR